MSPDAITAALRSDESKKCSDLCDAMRLNEEESLRKRKRKRQTELKLNLGKWRRDEFVNINEPRRRSDEVGSRWLWSPLSVAQRILSQIDHVYNCFINKILDF